MPICFLNIFLLPFQKSSDLRSRNVCLLGLVFLFFVFVVFNESLTGEKEVTGWQQKKLRTKKKVEAFWTWKGYSNVVLFLSSWPVKVTRLWPALCPSPVLPPFRNCSVRLQPDFLTCRQKESVDTTQRTPQPSHYTWPAVQEMELLTTSTVQVLPGYYFFLTNN